MAWPLTTRLVGWWWSSVVLPFFVAEPEAGASKVTKVTQRAGRRRASERLGFVDDERGSVERLEHERRPRVVTIARRIDPV